MAKRKQPKQRAKLFWTGRSQAVRLPKEFRFEGESVLIRRDGSRVVLEPDTGDEWPEGFFEWFRENPVVVPIPRRSKKHRKIAGWP